MSLFNIASRVNRVEIEVKSKVSRNNPTFTGTVSGITKGSIGLGSVDNTTDLNKPISTLTGQALDAKAPKDSPAFTGAVSFTGATSVAGLNKNMVSLGSVDNTTDLNKPISTLTGQALNNKQDKLSATTDIQGEFRWYK